jgi:hypothetical protein
MDHPVRFTDGSLSTRWRSAVSDPHWLEADLGSAQHGYSIYELRVNGSWQ